MFDTIDKFEKIIAEFYGAPYAVSTDCCTHAIELCLRLTAANNVTCPNHTYISIPHTFNKLNLSWSFSNDRWKDYYFIGNTHIVDAAVLWKENSYIPATFMCLSFQFKKHLSLGRGGMILLDNKIAYEKLIRMSYDGRSRNLLWAEQDISTVGYHYYMTPETAQLGISKLNLAKEKIPKLWSSSDYPNLSNMQIFKENNNGRISFN